MILIVDNYDSFTFNLVHVVKNLGFHDYRVVKNDQIPWNEMNEVDRILFSPGPGVPSEAGDMMRLIETYGATKYMLGICLGHQAIAEVYGARLVNLAEVFHGISSQVECTEAGADDPLFAGVGPTFAVGRYHSWVVSEEAFPSCLQVLARSSDGQVMALKHRWYPVYGVQFHPESILTPLGEKIIRNFLCLPNQV